MKRFLRVTLLILLLLAAGGMITWYFIMKRTVPAQACCIPKNAMGVLTLNLRELVLDHASGKHLFPGFEDNKKLPGPLGFMIRAAEQNGGSGISESSDVLGFMYQDGEAAFIGLAAVITDKEKFSSLILAQVSKNYPIEKVPGGSLSIVRFDSSSAVLGWNDKTALFLYPFSNHGSEDVARQCGKLLTQTREQSVLANENFRSHELSSFDAGFWLQADPLLHFTGGGKLARTALNGTDYISFNIDFREGETDIRRIVTNKAGATKETPSITTIPCDPKEIKGFWKFALALSSPELVDASIGSPPMNLLPFSDEEMNELVKTMDGSCLLLVHDSVSYDMPYIGYKYDEEFNQETDTLYKKETQPAMSYCFGLKDVKKTQELLSAYLGKSNSPSKNEWKISDNGAPARIFICGNLLVYSQWPECDEKARKLPDPWQGREMEINAGDYLSSTGLIDFLLLNLGDTHKLLTENLGVLTIMEAAPVGNIRSSEIRLQMKNTEVNALVQLEDIFRKGTRQ